MIRLMNAWEIANLVFLIACVAFAAGMVLGMVLVSEPAPKPVKPFFPGEEDQPVWEGPNWDLPGVQADSKNE